MQSEHDEAEIGLRGSVGTLKMLVVVFGLVSMLGTIWLAWIDDRRLRMTDDFAAVSGTAVLALLVTAFVEVHLYMKKAKTALSEYSSMIEESEEPVSFILRDRHVGAYVQGLASVTWLWGIVTSILTGNLVLIVLWACVDGHGPARWLAWLTFLSVCYGFVFVTVVALLKVAFDGDDSVQLYWKIQREQAAKHQAVRERRERHYASKSA